MVAIFCQILGLVIGVVAVSFLSVPAAGIVLGSALVAIGIALERRE